MEACVGEGSKENVQSFHNLCLTLMADDMAKNLPAIGYKLFIQMLVHKYPKIAVDHLQKYISLRNSYQNRQPIGLSIFWALGQGGIKDFAVGFKGNNFFINNILIL